MQLPTAINKNHPKRVVFVVRRARLARYYASAVGRSASRQRPFPRTPIANGRSQPFMLFLTRRVQKGNNGRFSAQKDRHNIARKSHPPAAPVEIKVDQGQVGR